MQTETGGFGEAVMNNGHDHSDVATVMNTLALIYRFVHEF